MGEKVEVLAGVADRMGPSEPERVVETTVDALGIVAARIELGEVGIAWWDGSDVLGAVESAGLVGVVAAQPHGDGGAPTWSGSR